MQSQVRKKSFKDRHAKPKHKIRWDQLGLHDPSRGKPALSMDEIRRQVLTMAGEGLGGRRSVPLTGSKAPKK